MKRIVLLLLLASAPVHAGWLSGTRPADLGIHDGQLSPPPSAPHAVSSRVSSGHAAIAPLAISGTPAACFERLKALVASDAGARIISSQPDYLYAEYTSALLGFVDDVEFQLDAANGVIQVRSASRLGYSDLGANRRRIESLRARL